MTRRAYTTRERVPASLALHALTALFAARVAGQLVVLAWAPDWLPPFDEWYSGWIPYPILLPAQLLILAAQVRICRAIRRGDVPLSRAASRRVRRFAWAYAAVMAARYAATMAIFPERRWLTGTIPIWFHLVLAGFLGAYARIAARANFAPRGPAARHPPRATEPTGSLP